MTVSPGWVLLQALRGALSEHDYSSCSDEALGNHERCRRCAAFVLVETLDSGRDQELRELASKLVLAFWTASDTRPPLHADSNGKAIAKALHELETWLNTKS